MPPHFIGIDGGGTHTLALLADAAGTVLGRGLGGPSNIQAVGEEAALVQLDMAVRRAFEEAKLTRTKVAAACLGLAGIDLTEGLDVIHAWSERVGLANKVSVANDATLLLAAGTPAGWGLAVIAGTGSIAFTIDESGKDGRAGGWGHLLGDEGSAFQVVLQSLRASARFADACGPRTALLDAFVSRMGLKEPRDLIPAVYRREWDRAALASLAPVVFEVTASGDEVALRVMRTQADELARTAAAAVKNSALPAKDLPVALAGGVLLKSDAYQSRFLESLAGFGVTPGPVGLVEEPATGAVVLARRVMPKAVDA
ncbi:MAG TPA: BadF/BadG/BcrA/BcrD ATPase family protein [Gemmataceae bacterium]|nr:BadF/BadG/BcrA/BcrD ATPase family protein [Gemmataceae bacterium]